MKFITSIEFPNGEGYTPCTLEYAETMEARDAIYDATYEANYGPDRRTLEDLSPEDYQRWMELDNKLLTMQANGHLGRSVRY